MPANRSSLLIYNTVDRLLRGDLFHTVTTADVIDDLAAFPPDFPLVGIGTTSWLRRNGEVIAEGSAASSRFLWADPESKPVGQVIDVCWQRPTPGGTALVTPRLDDNDEQANFPFLAVAVCDPAQSLRWDMADAPNAHEAVTKELVSANVGVAGVQLRGKFGRVETTDAYNMPLGGLDLSKGYTGDQFFRFAQYEGDVWVMSGIFAANSSLQPFISVAGRPLHLHGYRGEERDGGHIVRAEAVEVSITAYPLDDLILRIHDVAHAMLPAKADEKST
jgi:hypothetical protein